MIQNNSKKIRLLISYLFILFIILGLNNSIKIVNYTIDDKKINTNIRIAFISDLHSCNYGEKQSNLTKIIDKSKPDIILLGGDIVDDELPEDKAWEFLSWCGKNYPTYYVTGNHEFWISDFDRVIKEIKNNNINVLSGEKVELNIKNQKIDLFGIDDPYVSEEKWHLQLKNINEKIDKNNFSILLSHRPERYNYYKNFDMSLTGHSHGGQWRIPFILNGLIAPNQGLFPKYAGGMYKFKNHIMIVSRGLAKESTRIPRFYNRPEYVIIDIS